ncbi:hypothetical protein L873DRAFT_1846705 [Choiromyces venosus 120613-1]|uniref:Lytic polysaccharide monooxygenase n=1 Tax=Choiromyces venosus 120613-1 TaxID=1336337 RepID=A0A3N4J7M2_9PEZI|nr:hypothetical protein L873DRAFT_1846705 [Choiromyces venosus 120613-1]
MHSLSILLLFLLPLASAHMTLNHPCPLNHPGNPNTSPGTGDYDYKSPIKAATFPCKGFQKLLGTPAGKSVETWAAGSTQNFTLAGTVTHGGGSCQASISEDGGKTFRVIRSYVGGCPALGKEFDFVVPKETKSGDVLFAWTWFNNLGGREMYMNCAAVTISNGGTQGLSHLPEIFQANLGNGCETVPSRDLLFPTPGDDVAIVNPAASAPVGNCELGLPAGSRGNFTSALVSPAPATPSAPSVAASKSATLVAPSSPSSFANPTGCMCICGGPSGYAANILPLSALDNIAEKTPASFLIDQFPNITGAFFSTPSASSSATRRSTSTTSGTSSPTTTKPASGSSSPETTNSSEAIKSSSSTTNSSETTKTSEASAKGRTLSSSSQASGLPKPTEIIVKISSSGGLIRSSRRRLQRRLWLTNLGSGRSQYFPVFVFPLSLDIG